MIRIVRAEDTPFFRLPSRTSGPTAGKPIRHYLPFYRAFARGLSDNVGAIVATSDLQGRENGGDNRLLGAQVAESLKKLAEQSVIPHPDAVLLCGDLYDYPDCNKRGGNGEEQDVFRAFSKSTSDVFAVLGNHETLANRDAVPGNVKILEGQVERLGSLRVVGVSGIIGSPRRNQRRTEDDFLGTMEGIIHQSPDLLLLHQGPLNVGKCWSITRHPRCSKATHRLCALISFQRKKWK